jgi:hypothetical protein
MLFASDSDYVNVLKSIKCPRPHRLFFPMSPDSPVVGRCVDCRCVLGDVLLDSHVGDSGQMSVWSAYPYHRLYYIKVCVDRNGKQASPVTHPIC